MNRYLQEAFAGGIAAGVEALCFVFPAFLVYMLSRRHRLTRRQELVLIACAFCAFLALYDLTGPAVRILRNYSCRHASNPASCRGDVEAE